MSEAHSYLFHGEEVVLVVRPHPVVLARRMLLPLVSVALFAAVPTGVTAVILLILLTRFGWDIGLWWVDRYVLTTDRVLSMAGVITKKVVSLPLVKITDLTYKRSILGRLLGYGSLDLESAGQQDFGRIDFLPDPDHFYRAIMSLALGPRPKPVVVANEEQLEQHIDEPVGAHSRVPSGLIEKKHVTQEIAMRDYDD